MNAVNMIMRFLLTCLTLLLLLLAICVDATKDTTSDHIVDSATASLIDVNRDEALDIVELYQSLRFEPPEIDFGVWSVGVPRSHKVTLVNDNANRSVYLSSVSGRSPIFFSSFFESRVVPPLSNTTFEVVFLPRKTAVATDYLMVHTSFGQARLSVRGEGFECPYRLKPIVGIKAPLNAFLTPEIYMYNPHSNPLQIVEVYSSGGQFQLELPSGLPSAPQALWEIPPYTTKPIIRIKFHGNSAGNHTAFIRIKIAQQSKPESTPLPNNMEDVLVVPVEFEILPEQGMYAGNPVLDFGRLTTVKSKTPLQLKMEVQSSDNQVDEDMIMLAEGETLVSGLRFEESDGSLTLDTQSFNATTMLDELLTLQAKSKIGPKFTVRVRAEIFKGTLYFNRNSSLFVTNSPRYISGVQRTFTVRNDFEFPITLLNVSIAQNDSKIIQTLFSNDYTTGMVLQPGQSADLLHMKVVNERGWFNTQVTIVTNITNFENPLLVCNGRLHISTHVEPIINPSESFNHELNMGSVPLTEMSEMGFIALHNFNPVLVKLTNWNFKSPKGVYFHTTAMGCLNDASLAQLRANVNVNIVNTNFRFCSQLNQGDVAVFAIAIQSYITEMKIASLQIWTPYENITTNIIFHTWMGKLEVDQESLSFKNCFPGKLCSSELSIRSTFQHPIHITAINFSDVSIRFQNADSKKLIYALTPNAVTRIGRVFFEPALHCLNRCYIPQDDKLTSLAFPNGYNENNNFHFDEAELRRRTELYRQMKWYFRTISFTLHSRELRQLKLQAFIDIEWPKLVVGGKQKFPTIEIGKTQEYVVTLRNPTPKLMLVDYFLADPEYARQTKLSLPLEVVDISSNCYLTDQNVFSIRGSVNPQLPKPILIPAFQSTNLVVRFEAPAQEADTFCTLLHIRNNLTMYEAVWLSAKSVQSQFRFGNRKPGSTTALFYDIQEKHLAACQHRQPVIAKRTFTARNTGEVPIFVESFVIGRSFCEGYGFKVVGCGKGFELKANESRKIEIAFRPDFTLSRVTRPLTIITNLSYDISYTLTAQLPPAAALETCINASLFRPSWETHVRIGGVLVLLISFVLVVASSHVDAENINNTQAALYLAREKGSVHPTFNLRHIATKSNTTGTCTTAEKEKLQRSGSQVIQHKPNCSYLRKRAVTGAGGTNVKKLQTTCCGCTIRPMPLVTDVVWQLEPSEPKPSVPRQQRTTPNERHSKSSPTSDNPTDQIELTTGTGTGHSKSSPPQSKWRPPSTLRAQDPIVETAFKKQKSPPVTKLRILNRRSRNIPQLAATTPPTQSRIIELMDKEVNHDEVENTAEKQTNKTNEATIKKDSVPDLPPIVEKKPVTKPLKSHTEKRTIEKVEKSNSNTNMEKLTESPNTVTIQTITTSTTTPTVTATTTTTTTTATTLTTPKIKDNNAPIKFGKTPGRERRKEKLEKIEKNEKIHKADKPEINLNNNDNTMTNSQSSTSSSSTLSSSISTSSSIAIEPVPIPTVMPALATIPITTIPITSVPTSTISAASSSSSLNSSSNGGCVPRRSERREKRVTANKAVQALNFNDIPVQDSPKVKRVSTKTAALSPIHTISSPWDAIGKQQVPLNEILQVPGKVEEPKNKTSKSSKQIEVTCGAGNLHLLDKAILQFGLTDEPTTPKKEIVNDSTPAANILTNIAANNAANSEVRRTSGTTELGPIGTKKSPSSTPVWESVIGNHSASVRAPLQPKPMNSNSFFSNFLSNAGGSGSDTSKFGYPNRQPYLGGVTAAGLYELKKAQEELRRELEANEYLLNLRQQQLKEQRRQQQQQQELLQSLTASAHWPTTSVTPVEEATWAPIGYNPHSSLAIGESSRNVISPNNLTNLDNWRSGSPMRPPPGLNPTAIGSNFSNSLDQQVSHNGNNNSNSNNTNNNPQKEEEETRIFDPFSSLSSIWSDNWNKASSNKNNQDKND